MEESPILNVPDTEEKNDFIITTNKEDNCEQKEKNIKPQAVEMTETSNPTTIQSDEFDLSDITAKPKTQSREDIIAAAEAAAFAE